MRKRTSDKDEKLSIAEIKVDSFREVRKLFFSLFLSLPLFSKRGAFRGVRFIELCRRGGREGVAVSFHPAGTGCRRAVN